MILIKSHNNIQFWYFIVWPTVILPISDRRLRWRLFLFYPLMDITSTLAIFHYYVGPLAPEVYRVISVFKPIL